MADWQETLNDIARLEADNAALKKLLTEKDALIHQLGENAATAAREYAENMAALRAEVERLREALRPFAIAADAFLDAKRVIAECPSLDHPRFYLVARDLHRARAALTERKP